VRVNTHTLLEEILLAEPEPKNALQRWQGRPSGNATATDSRCFISTTVNHLQPLPPTTHQHQHKQTSHLQTIIPQPGAQHTSPVFGSSRYRLQGPPRNASAIDSCAYVIALLNPYLLNNAHLCWLAPNTASTMMSTQEC
jgi:hypothetical protein